MEYNELSRRGLIKLNSDFDKTNNEELKKYLESGINTYEGVKPYEEVFATMEDSIDKIKHSSSGVSDAMINRTKKIVDKMMNTITSEIDRIKNSIEDDEEENSITEESDDD